VTYDDPVTLWRRPSAFALIAVTCWGVDAHALDPAKSPSQYVSHLWQQSDEGLPQNFVPAIAQTRDGYLWLATQEGIVRFDGARFVIFSAGTIPEIGSNDVDALAADAEGGLWIGTRGGGLTHYGGGTFTRYTTKDGLAHDVVLTVKVARDGTVWIGTRGGGVSSFKGGRFATLHEKDGLANDTVTALTEAPDGAMWFGTDGGGVSRYDVATAHFTTVKAGLSDPSVSALYADADGTVWIGTLDGLDRWHGGTVSHLPVTGTVHALLRESGGNLWIAAQDGIRRLSPPGSAAASASAEGTPTPFGTLMKLDGDGTHHFEAGAFLEDREGNLWAGMETIGLVQLQDGKVTTFGTDFFWTTFLDAHGTLWLGGDPGVFTVVGDRIAPVPGMANASVIGMAQGAGDAIWLGTTAHGLYRYENGKPTGVGDISSQAEGSIRSLYPDSRGVLWFGTNFGLYRYEGGKVTHLRVLESGPDPGIRAFAEAPDGSMWMAASTGLLRLKDGKFTLLGEKDGLSNESVESLYLDGDDLWIGTYGGGLNLFRAGKLGRVTTKSGLFNDVVYSITDDQLGSLWMSCNRGVFHATKADLVAVATGAKERLTSISLGTSDGMRSSECNSGVPGVARTRDGLLWYPTAQGAARIDPAHMRKNQVVPPVLIEEMRVDRAPVDVRTVGDLPAGSRDFEIVYTALSFTASERVRFKYKLEGFDKDWVDAGPRRVAYYTNLTPGRYAFAVKAANDDGVWNETGASLSFTLRPRFFQTLWFAIACALGLVLIGAGSVRLRLLALRKKAEELEAKVLTRTQELANASAKLEGAFRALAQKDELLQEDLLQAKAFQEHILPRLPSGGAVRFRAIYRPAGLVGGDVYDVCELGEGHFRVFLADTTGHGVQASLRTMVLKTEYDRVKESPEGPGRVLAELNKKLATVYPDLAMRCSACCFDVITDDEGARVRYANAAHPPLLRVSGGVVDEIYLGATFLGIMADATFRELETRLGPSDRLLAYTDGICEQEDEEGRPFGIERMEELLSGEPRSAEEIVEELDHALTRFAAGRRLADDVVLLCIECAGDRRSMVSVTSPSWVPPR
jgi:ligand-binding sensor domain-containing protein/serine phosphatase RsbU (regulator of sigma subunit)